MEVMSVCHLVSDNAYTICEFFFLISFTNNCWVVPIFRHTDPQQCSLQKFSVDLYLYPINCFAEVIEVYRGFLLKVLGQF